MNCCCVSIGRYHSHPNILFVREMRDHLNEWTIWCIHHFLQCYANTTPNQQNDHEAVGDMKRECKCRVRRPQNCRCQKREKEREEKRSLFIVMG